MTPERWRQINAVFEQALEQSSGERAAFLARACQGDEELRRRVEAMLAADARNDLLIDRPADEAAAGLLADQPSEAAVTQESEMLSGRALGSYRLLREIGRGGMGRVYLARDERLDRRVALKLLPASLTGDADRVARFQREARTASALNHPNILTIYDFGQDAGRHYIAAEFIEGRTLRALISQSACSPHQALDIAIQMASALDAAHNAGVIHRDIKPENVMLRPDGFIKILDFGLAKLTEAKARDWDVLRTSDSESGEEAKGSRGEEEKRRSGEPVSPFPLPPVSHSPTRSWATRPGMVMGTVAYMSPEQARGLELDARSDLFSLGIVLYEMLTGARPFRGDTQADVITALIEREPPPLNLISENESGTDGDELQRLISRALAKPVDKRYQTAGEMLEDLKRIRQDLEFTEKLRGGSAKDFKPGISRLVPERGRLYSYMQRHPRQVMAVLLFFVFLAARYLILPSSWWSWTNDEEISSIAVLPFANIGADPQREYLADGVTENLIDSLTRLDGVRVSASKTVFGYKGRGVDPRQAGKDLRVRAVVAGDVSWQGERLIIRAELIDASDGSRLWGDEFQRPRSNILTVQSEIAREIAAKLRRRLNPDSQQRRHSSDSRAYELYAQGRHSYLRYTRKSQEKALDYFREAIKLDPRYALAYCGIADVYADFSSLYMPAREAMPRARDAALKAIELDDALPEAHHSLALVKLWGDFDWVGAEREYKRALELNPNFVLSRIYYVELLTQQKRFEEALREIRRVEEYDPLLTQAQIAEGGVFFCMREYDRAMAIFRKVLERNPRDSGMQRNLAIMLSLKGQHQEALAQLSEIRADPPSVERSWLLASIYARAGQRDYALKMLRELESLAAKERVPPLAFVRVYVGLGDKEKAFAWLGKAYAEQSDHVLHLGADPFYDPLRSDPRFAELLGRVGLTP